MPTLESLICIRKLAETTYISYFTVKDNTTHYAQVYMDAETGKSLLLWDRSQIHILSRLRMADLVFDRRKECDWIL
jgi:hypothetical protein